MVINIVISLLRFEAATRTQNNKKSSESFAPSQQHFKQLKK